MDCCRNADRVHVDYPEDEAVVVERFRLYPAGCAVLDFEQNIAGYTLTHPWHYGAPPTLNTTLRALPRRSSTYYIHDLALLPETRDFIGEAEIALMKPTAVLINTARGGLIDENALLKALKENRIWGAGIDAFMHEPPEDKMWFELDNVVLGSHCAASTTGATENMGAMATENLIRDLR